MNKINYKYYVVGIAIIIIASIFGFINIGFAATATNEGVATASEVLVVYNASYTTDSNSAGGQDSLEIAQYYQTQHSVPEVNIMSITAPTTEIISRSDYNTHVKGEIETYLTNNSLVDSIKYIVLVKGVPLKISATNGGAYGETDYASVDASVCLLYETYNITWRLSNPYFNADPNYTKAYRFKTNHFDSSGVKLRYLATRIDAYTVADMKAMIDKAISPDTSGTKYWIIDDHLKTYDSMSTAYTKMKALDKNINPDPWSDTTSYLRTNASGSVIGYTSHGIHASMGDGYVSNSPVNANHLDFTFANGAAFSTYESYNAYGFTNKTQSTHGQLAEWIEIGGSVGVGNAYEPWASTIADESIWMPQYAIGYTWVDAVYMSLPYMDFVSVVIGDPLMIITETTAPAEVTATNAVAGDNQVSLTWTNPVDADLAGVKVLRKTGSYPANNSDGTLIYNGTNQSYIDTNVSNGTTYYYALFAYDEVPNYSSVDGAGAKATATPSVDTTPPGVVASMNAVPGNHQIALTWTNPSDVDFAGTKVVRKEVSYPTSHTDGTVVYNSTGESYTNTGLDNGTTYFYTAFAYDGGPNYSIPADGSRASATPYLEGDLTGIEIDIVPPGFVTNFSATPSDGQVSLAWTNPGDQDGVVVIRRSDYYPQTLSNGNFICQSIGTSCTDSNVINDTTYFYTAFAHDSNLNYSSFTSNSQDYATPCAGSCEDSSPETAPSPYFSEPDIIPPTQVDSFVATAGNGQVSLSWNNPFDDIDWLATIIIRKTIEYSNSWTDGTPVYNGTEASYVDTDVSNGTTYYYSSFTYDAENNYSAIDADSRDSATPSS